MHERHRSPCPSPSRSPCCSSKCPGENSLDMTEQSIWPRRGTVLGWSDPTFGHDSVPKVMRGVAPALKEVSCGVSPACFAGFQTKQVKKVRITLCTFEIGNFFTRRSAYGIHSQRFATARQAKIAAQNRANWAGATPLLGAFSRPKLRRVAPALAGASRRLFALQCAV